MFYFRRRIQQLRSQESDLLFQLMDEACRSAATDALQALPDEQKQALQQRIQELHDADS